MLKWLKRRIEINNRRNMNDTSDWTGTDAWSLRSFIIFYIIGLVFIITGIFLAIFIHPAAASLCLFGVAWHIWQFWHLCRYYGPEYDVRRGENNDEEKTDN